MGESRSNPVWSFLTGIWQFIRFTNHMVFFIALIVALFFFVMVITLGLSSGSARGPVQEKTALVLALKGNLVEQYTSAPIQRAFAQATGDSSREFQLRDLLAAIDAAKKDPKIDRIVLLTDGFNTAGFAALHELGAALKDFRSGGKQIIAYGAGMEQKQYYLAAQANEVYLDPDGSVLLEGIGRYRLFYREALQDKLGVDVHLFRVGEFKSAAEPYILDAASPASREADLFWMNDVWNRYVAEIAAARKLPVDAITTLVSTMPARVAAVQGDLAKLALDEKLVDGLKTPDEIETMLSQRGARNDEDDSFRQIDFDGYLAQQVTPATLMAGGPQVGVVVAEGEISDGKQAPGSVGGESTSELIRQARLDDDVKALVLRVNSPGGGVFPSEQIRREIALTKAAGKPVVVSMGNVAASGGYWISMNADRIYADSSTITGSIGIFGLWMSAPRALEKIGVRSDGVATTPLAGAFDPTRPLDPEAGNLIQSVINHGYAQFIGKVATARKSTPEKIDMIARGRVWSGAQAKERGLVDEIGGLREAQVYAAQLAKLGAPTEYKVRYVEPPLSPFDQFFLGMSKNARTASLVRAFGPAGGVVGQDTIDRVQKELSWLNAKGSNGPVRAVAHCLCDF
jgi:protease IV